MQSIGESRMPSSDFIILYCIQFLQQKLNLGNKNFSHKMFHIMSCFVKSVVETKLASNTNNPTP